MIATLGPWIHIFSFVTLSYMAANSIGKERYGLALGLIIFLGLYLRIYMASDPYLHIYDERYHTLVAKSLISHPLKPTLYADPILPYNITDWWSNHIWLSKPIAPFLLIATSLKIFGLNVIAVRLPSVVIDTLMIAVIHILGKKYFEQRVALVAAYLYSIHGLILELVGGRKSADHTDICFLFFSCVFISLSLRPATRRLAIMAGLALGLAFLSKWISAFLPLLVVVVFKIKDDKGIDFMYWSTLLLSFLFLPFLWLSFCYFHYREETLLLFTSTIGAVFDDSSPHIQAWYFYIDRIRIIFGELIYIPIILLLIKIWKKNYMQKELLLFIWIVIPMIFLSMASTKRVTYILLSAPAFFLLTAHVFYQLWDTPSVTPMRFRYLRKTIAILLIILPMRYSFERLKFFQSPETERYESALVQNISNMGEFDTQCSLLVNEPYAIEFMFYHDMMAYSHMPSKNEIEVIQNNGYTLLLRKGEKMIPLNKSN